MVPPITFYAPAYAHKADAQPRLRALWPDVDAALHLIPGET